MELMSLSRASSCRVRKCVSALSRCSSDLKSGCALTLCPPPGTEAALTHKEKLVLNFSEQSRPSPLLVHVSNFPHPCATFQGTKSPKSSPPYSLYSAKASILFPTPNSSDLHGVREEALLRSSPTTTAVKDFSSFTHSSC